MRRDLLASLGIQLPVLPTIVLGGLPGTSNWAPRLERIGLDVVSSGAVEDTQASYEAARAAVPHRPFLSATADHGPSLVVDEWGGVVYPLGEDPIVEIVAGDWPGDANDVARLILERVLPDPSEWWVAAGGLATIEPVEAEHILATLTEGARHVRLYLAKQQTE